VRKSEQKVSKNIAEFMQLTISEAKVMRDAMEHTAVSGKKLKN